MTEHATTPSDESAITPKEGTIFILTLACVGITAGLIAFFIWCTAFFPHGDPRPSVTDWISAIGQGVGALLTGVAVVVAAATYRGQMADKHDELEDKRKQEAQARSAQAANVNIRIATDLPDDEKRVDLLNRSKLPIYNMRLYCIDVEGRLVERQPLVQDVVFDEFSSPQFEAALRLHTAYVEFADSAGVEWVRTSKGTLVESGKRPESFDPRELEVKTPQIPMSMTAP